MSTQLTGAPQPELLPLEAEPANGATLAAFVAAGVGAFAMGAAVLLHEAGVFSMPTVYAPAGGVSGRTTFAVLVWLVAWAVLHLRWRGRSVPPGRAWTLTLVLTVAGILGTFPPVWKLF
jgi:hypothetical protein